MTNPREWVWTTGPAGLVRVAWSEGGNKRQVVVRTRRAKGGTLEIGELHFPDPTPATLRELRLGTVEKFVNTPGVREELLARMDEDAPDALAAFARVHVRAGTGAVGTIAAGAVTLERPARLDDDFYMRVLRARDHATGRGEPILRTLMDASGAPRNTVARWLKEAKRREKRLRAGAAV